MLAADRQSRDLKKLVALMIGFFVSTVFVRWWSQFTVWTILRHKYMRHLQRDGVREKGNVPHNLKTSVVATINCFQNIANADYIAYLLLGFTSHKEDTEKNREEARLYMRVVVRYVNLAIIQTLRAVSPRIAKRFKTHDDLVNCGEMKLLR